MVNWVTETGRSVEKETIDASFFLKNGMTDASLLGILK